MLKDAAANSGVTLLLLPVVTTIATAKTAAEAAVASESQMRWFANEFEMKRIGNKMV